MANRSPSPVSTKSNPISRTPETNYPMRRSLAGNPFTRPADFAKRHKEGGAVSSRGHRDKENDKDQNLKSEKVRSPATVKGARNFMAPTTSAASKINASPRRKILADRNEPVRTPLSFSDGKSLSGSLDVTQEIKSKSEMGLNQDSKVEDSNDSAITKKDVSLNSQVPLKSQNIWESSLPELYMKPSGSSTSPVIATIDVDPSLPPYDPKTNYLSPRPRFRYYKPKPRIQVHLHEEKKVFGYGEGKTLEESFLSESFSDTEVTEEFESENTREESEEVSSAEDVNEVESNVSEPKSSSRPIVTHLSKDTVEKKRVLKQKFLTRSKSAALVFVLSIACLSLWVTDSPVFDSPVYKDLSSVYKPYGTSKMADFTKATFDGFARKFRQWSANPVCYFSRRIRNIEVDTLGPSQFGNLTSLEDPFVGGHIKVEHIEERLEEIHEKGDELEPTAKEEVEIELLEENPEQGDSVVEAGDGSEEAHLTLEAEVTEPNNSSEAVQNEEQSDTTLNISVNLQGNIGFEDQSAQILKSSELKPEVQVLEINPEAVQNKETQFQCDNDRFISCAEIDPTTEDAAAFGDVQSPKSVASSFNLSEDKFSVHYMQAIPPLALVLIAAKVFVYLKHRRRISNPSSTAVFVDPLLTKKLMGDITNKDRPMPSSQIWSPGVDVAGESCPSGMSSSQKSLSYIRKEQRGTNEAPSQEKRKQRKTPRRESLASSSEYSMCDSPSYGSFTTYERISRNHGCGDEEIVTPVRRSSRIRNQLSSP